MPQKHVTAYVFLDANLHLQFRDFDQIDWPSILGYRSVCLVIAPVTFSELEKFKYDQTSERRRKRSRAITKKINEILFPVPPGQNALVPDRPDVTLRVLTDSPDVSLYPGLEPTIRDDQLVATIMKFISDNPAVDRKDVILVSEDGGLLNKARARDIAIHVIDDQYRLEDEPTTDQQKITRLERKLVEIESKQPKLRLALVKDGYPVEELDFHIEIIAGADEGEINQQCEAEAAAISWSPPHRSDSSKTPAQQPESGQRGSLIALETAQSMASISDFLQQISKSPFLSITQEEIDRYERDKKEYLDRYKRYLIQLQHWQRIYNLCRDVEFAAINEGTAPAIGVIMQLVFPDELKIMPSGVPIERPDKPSRPEPPMTTLQRLTQITRVPGRSMYDHLYADLASPHLGPLDPDEAGPTITPDDSTRVEWKRSRVLHQLPLKLTPLGILFPEVEGEQHYQITYRIFAENLAKPVSSVLHIATFAEVRKFTF